MNVIRSFSLKFKKENSLYYRVMKLSLVFFLLGVCFIFINILGVSVDSTVVRVGSAIGAGVSIMGCVFSYLFMLIYSIYSTLFK